VTSSHSQSQEKCDTLFRDLLKSGYPCLSLHGGKDQSDRECTISDFKVGLAVRGEWATYVVYIGGLEVRHGEVSSEVEAGGHILQGEDEA
jgi:ATP-dependent RNA helicase DDX46/PRP5